ncbi:hypothetical protein ICN82_02070 [Mangrovicoccus sp. HB182678]|uniref:Uncharacterized protein n=2 Tax=Mangrovicoccus algicola TaxID=2771008 RepID=A0A8J7CTU0_9RHOB|nr:hypothetical protein [Mangrovicoccus algicola]
MLATLALAVLCAGPVAAQPAPDPSWPCIQRKVPRLSPGLMWARPLPQIKLDAETAAEAADVVSRLVLRRAPPEEARPALDAFAQRHGDGPEMMGYLFSESFERLSQLRGRIMRGIEDYAESQIALSARIERNRREMERLMAAPEPDFDRVDALERQVMWDERVFADRQQSLTYVCETPVLLEKRLYAISRMLEARIGG